jgi:hypothetical protein
MHWMSTIRATDTKTSQLTVNTTALYWNVSVKTHKIPQDDQYLDRYLNSGCLYYKNTIVSQLNNF